MLPTEGAPDPAPVGERSGAVRPVIERAHRQQFERDGFVSIAQPIVGPDELDAVRAIVAQLLPRAHGRHVRDLGRGGPDEGEILEIEETTELAPELRRTAVFRRCRQLATELLGTPMAPFYDHIIRKPPHNRAATAWHQDSAYAAVRTPLPPSAHIWFALQDVTVDNGCMQFVPGSHRTPVRHRPRGGDPTADALEAVEVATDAAVACPLPAGGVTIHHPGVLHHTGPNHSDHPRVAWILQFREEGSWGMRAMVPGPVRRIVRRRR